MACRSVPSAPGLLNSHKTRFSVYAEPCYDQNLKCEFLLLLLLLVEVDSCDFISVILGVLVGVVGVVVGVVGVVVGVVIDV